MSFVDGQPFFKCCGEEIKGLLKVSHRADTIEASNVWQERDDAILAQINALLQPLLLPESGISGEEHLADFLSQVKSGKRGVIFVEHYSNLDLPGLVFCLKNSKNPACAEIADRLVAIAGMKLNEDSPFVNAFLAGYSRIVIYPSRRLDAITDEAEREKEIAKSRSINMAAMRALDKARREGKIIVVFPAGTRFRPNKPETKRGLREIDSYLRLFDTMILISINGNCLRMSQNEPENMAADEAFYDVLRFCASEPIDCKKFRDEMLASLDDSTEDKKQATVDKIMQKLDELHEIERPNYERLCKLAR